MNAQKEGDVMKVKMVHGMSKVASLITDRPHISVSL
jgi:hypothetical protein